jgi:hypothetical protein
VTLGNVTRESPAWPTHGRSSGWLGPSLDQCFGTRDSRVDFLFFSQNWELPGCRQWPLPLHSEPLCNIDSILLGLISPKVHDLRWGWGTMYIRQQWSKFTKKKHFWNCKCCWKEERKKSIQWFLLWTLDVNVEHLQQFRKLTWHPSNWTYFATLGNRSACLPTRW